MLFGVFILSQYNMEGSRMSVVHFDIEKIGVIMPLSGKHNVMACGQWLQDSQYPGRASKEESFVTCKRCLKILNHTNKQEE